MQVIRDRLSGVHAENGLFGAALPEAAQSVAGTVYGMPFTSINSFQVLT